MIKIDRRLGIVIAILIILIVGYKLKGYLASRKSRKGGKKSRKGEKKSGKSGNSGKSKKNSSGESKAKQQKSRDDSSDSESSSDDEVDVKHDAKTLYALIHSDMCRGMSLDEFQKRTSGNDSISDSIFYIELKQIYNTCVEEGRNPESTVKISDYINVLGKK